MRFIIPILFFCLTSFAEAQYRGLTVLALRNPNFPCDSVVEALKGVRNPSIQILLDFFGEDNACLRKLRRKYPDLHVQVHLVFNRHDERPSPIRARLRKLPRGTSVISLTLEDGYSTTTFRKLLRIAIRNAPGIPVVRNPMRPAPPSGASLYELHSLEPCTGKPRPNISSTDGFNLTDRELAEWVEKAEYGCAYAYYVWRPSWQGIYGPVPPPGNPRKRDFKFPPSDVALVQSLLR